MNSAWSKKNGFEDYNVDIEEFDWPRNLQRKIHLLKTDKDYLQKWYEIRDENVVKYKQDFNNFCTELVKIIGEN